MKKKATSACVSPCERKRERARARKRRIGRDREREVEKSSDRREGQGERGRKVLRSDFPRLRHSLLRVLEFGIRD
jgi:hypothetical protein